MSAPADGRPALPGLTPDQVAAAARRVSRSTNPVRAAIGVSPVEIIGMAELIDALLAGAPERDLPVRAVQP